MRRASFALGLAVLTLAGCNQDSKVEAVEPLTQADATAVLDEFKDALQSMDLQKIDAMYADNVVAFDANAPDRIDGKIALHVMNAQFVDMKFDHAELPAPKIQILGPDLFIASGLSRFTSSTGKVKEAEVRYTEVMKKQADGTWQSIHEHIDFPPKQ